MPTIPAPETSAAALLADPPSEDLLRAYDEAGAMVVRRLIGQDWLEKLRDRYDHMAAWAVVPSAKGVPTPDARKLAMRNGMWEDDDAFREFLFASPIAQAASIVMRSRQAQLYEDLLITEPAGGSPHESWHQDEGTWPVEGRMLSSVWFSLEPAGPESGAMRYVAGSHNGPIYYPPHVNPAEVGNDVERWTGGPFPRVTGNPDVTVLQTETEPGDAVIFHPRAIHCSYGSSPVHARRTFTIRFMGEDARWLPRNRMFYPWMAKLGLKKGDRIAHPRLPVVFAERVH